MTEATAALAQGKPAARIDRGAWSWALFEWARNPWVLLGTIYVFTPYISNVVIGDPVRGQSIIAGWHTTSGAIIAFTAPFLGAATDRMGRRKPLLGVAAGVLALAMVAMWWALPNGAGLPLWAIGLAVIVSSISFVYTEVVHNAMLTRAAPPGTLSHVSGLGLALGSVASVLLLVFVLVTMALPGQVALPFLPDAPMFGLDPAQYEPSRIVTLLCAAWLIVFSIPIFLYTPDLTTTGESFGAALKNGVGNVVRTVMKLRDYRNVALFLIARMLYADGKTAILIFSGVYASGTMEWNLVEMLAYGITLTIFAIAGGLGAGLLDHAVGVKRAVVIEIGVTILCLIGMVSMAPGSIFFTPIEPNVAVWDSQIFSTAPELAYLGFAILIAISITAAYASSRSLMARLAPAGMEGELFGLYALAGSATAWLAPGLVAYFTSTTQSLRVGFASIVVLLLAGFLLLLFVKPPARERAV
ncbi:MFS transporter [Terricaulis silvestris]|uniref:Vacuole effluxer Atg22 like protein n=1 Tax=Terricaulis silvestris TaxID=2686094 RepID=A0A6I6MXJ3_9CAUL|nr:MFS transporter [Terricaulis silvestris]QGZ97064.1 Vacuole effluxer Atg22 like protein [Terricaulis silvestris]